MASIADAEMVEAARMVGVRAAGLVAALKAVRANIGVNIERQ